MLPVDTRASALRLGLAVVIGLAFTGFFVGTTDEVARSAPTPAPEQVAREGLREAPSYTELRSSARGTGPGWPEEQALLAGLSPSRLDPVERDDAALDDLLLARAERRAYDGAPPTIPHPVQQGGYPECLACHEEGLKIRDRTAPAMPHASLTSCTQCHVSTASGPPTGGVDEGDALSAGSSFTGLAAPVRGPRAWDVAPPQVPHTSRMRDNCLACHGVNGASPMRSTHPSRESCTQCHTSTAVRDQRLWPTD